MKRIFILCAYVCCCIAAFSLVNDEATKGSGDVLVAGDMLPLFSAVTNDGQKVTTANLSGRPCVIVFFNTGCGDCRRELPAVQKVYDEFKDRVNFVCIGREEPYESVLSFWKFMGLTMPVSPQPDRTIYNLFAQRGIPRTYMCNEEGRIVHTFNQNVNRRKLRKCLMRLLGL